MDAMAELVVKLEKKAEAAILHLAGSLVVERLEIMQACLEKVGQEATSRVIVNLAECPFVDTGGVALLARAHIHARQSGRTFFLVGLQPQVKKLLELTRLDRVFEIRLSVAAALAS